MHENKGIVKNVPTIPFRRISDRIDALFYRLSRASDADSVHVTRDLHRALSEYSLRIRNRTMAAVLKWPQYPRDRRRATFGG
jgi:hypothetical protein